MRPSLVEARTWKRASWKRLASTLAWDVRVQWRSGFYWAAAFVAGIFIFPVSYLDTSTQAYLLPAFVLMNLQINTFYFLGGLVLLEKRQGSLEALIVTPLRRSEYLLSKAVTLTFLSLLENLAIVLAVYRGDFHLLPFLVGAVVASLTYVFCGFAVVARYDSINEYLMPSFVVVTLLSLPLLSYFDLVPELVLVAHPLQGPLIWLDAAFAPQETARAAGRLALYLGLPLLWTIGLYAWSLRSFDNFVVAREGAS